MGLELLVVVERSEGYFLAINGGLQNGDYFDYLLAIQSKCNTMI